MDGAGALQVDATELRLVRGQVLQTSTKDPPRRRPLGAPLQDLRPHEVTVQSDRDRIAGAEPTGPSQHPVGLVGSTQLQLELGGQQGGRAGLRRLTRFGELSRQPPSRGQQPTGRPPGGLIGLQQHQLGGSAPAVVAVPAEPVPRPGGQPSGVRHPAGEQRDLGAGQIDLAEVLPAAVAAEQLSGLAKGVVGLVGEAGRQQHAGSVEVGDPLLGVAVELDAVVHELQGTRKVTRGELEAAEVVEGDAPGIAVGDDLGAACGADQVHPSQGDLAHLDEQGPAVEEQPDEIHPRLRQPSEGLAEGGLGVGESAAAEEDESSLTDQGGCQRVVLDTARPAE